MVFHSSTSVAPPCNHVVEVWMTPSPAKKSNEKNNYYYLFIGVYADKLQ